MPAGKDITNKAVRMTIHRIKTAAAKSKAKAKAGQHPPPPPPPEAFSAGVECLNDLSAREIETEELKDTLRDVALAGWDAMGRKLRRDKKKRKRARRNAQRRQQPYSSGTGSSFSSDSSSGGDEGPRRKQQKQKTVTIPSEDAANKNGAGSSTDTAL